MATLSNKRLEFVSLSFVSVLCWCAPCCAYRRHQHRLRHLDWVRFLAGKRLGYAREWPPLPAGAQSRSLGCCNSSRSCSCHSGGQRQNTHNTASSTSSCGSYSSASSPAWYIRGRDKPPKPSRQAVWEHPHDWNTNARLKFVVEFQPTRVRRGNVMLDVVRCHICFYLCLFLWYVVYFISTCKVRNKVQVLSKVSYNFAGNRGTAVAWKLEPVFWFKTGVF